MPSSAFRFYAWAKLLSLGSHDLTTIVVAASLASSVGHNGFAALGADAHAGSGQLPVGTTTLVATSLGHFTLRDSHGDTSLVKLLFTAFIMDLLLKKLLQSSKSGIELLLAIAGTIVQVLAATAAQTLAVLLAQQLGIQIQDKNRPHNIIQIGAVSLQREYPLIFVLFVGKFCDQNYIDGEVNLPIETRSTAIASSVDGGLNRTGHHQNACCVANHTFSDHRFRYRIRNAVAKITQIHFCGKRNRCAGSFDDLGKAQHHNISLLFTVVPRYYIGILLICQTLFLQNL